MHKATCLGFPYYSTCTDSCGVCFDYVGLLRWVLSGFAVRSCCSIWGSCALFWVWLFCALITLSNYLCLRIGVRLNLY